MSAAKSSRPSIFATPATSIRAWFTPFRPPPRSSAASSGIDRLLALVPDAARERVEIRPHSATEVGLLLHGLEFARVRHGASAHSFAREDEITFGAGPSETPLTPENEDLCRDLLRRLFLSRHADGAHTDPLFRMAPERWLESRLRTALAELLPDLRGDLVYTQVPALSTGDRGMLDLLTLDRNARLVVLELKADEDLHLPLQALDYWIRVRALNADRQPAAGTAAPLSAFSAQRLLSRRRGLAAAAAPHPRRAGPAHSSRQRAGAALPLAANRVGTPRPQRALAPRTQDRLPQTQHATSDHCPLTFH